MSESEVLKYTLSSMYGKMGNAPKETEPMTEESISPSELARELEDDSSPPDIEDALFAIIVVAQEDPEGFNFNVLKEIMTSYGMTDIWNEAAQLLVDETEAETAMGPWEEVPGGPDAEGDVETDESGI